MKLDLKKLKLRKVNEQLQSLDRKVNDRDFTIINPEGNHAVCAGLTEELNISIKGHVGYYCAGMNQKANITIDWSQLVKMVYSNQNNLINQKDIIYGKQFEKTFNT